MKVLKHHKASSTLLSTGFYPGKKRATWKINTRLLNVLPSTNKVDYYYYYYYFIIIPPYIPDLSPCDFFLFPRLKKMLSGNKYTSRSSLGSAIYQCLQQIPKKDYLSAFRAWVKRLQKMCFSKGGIYLKVCNKNMFDKRSTELIRTQ